MEDKRKLIAAIMSAVTTYIETEEQPPPITPAGELKTRASRWQVAKRQDLMKVREMPTRKERAK